MDLKQKNMDILGVFKQKYIDLWWGTSAESPKLAGLLGNSGHAASEKEMDAILKAMLGDIKEFGSIGDIERGYWSARMKNQVRGAGKCLLGLSDDDMDLLLEGGFLKSASDFMNEAAVFDPTMGMDDVTQAIRNVWVMNCIQLLLGIEVRNTPSVFSYSMLYPYTDNYLDRPGASRKEKEETGARFKARLEGKDLKPLNRYEKGLFILVGMIEGQFPRASYDEVYESLVCIHNAQQKSLSQQKGSISPYELNLLDISFQKGGTSVLADAYLAKGSLKQAEAAFMFGFGVFLQLADDLQDTLSDMKAGHMTLFSQTAGKWPLDSLTNRLLNFLSEVLEGASVFSSPQSAALAAIMKKSCIALILSAIASNSRLYSRDYIERMESYSPLGFKYLRGLYKKIDSEYGKLKRKSPGKPVETEMLQALALEC